MLSELSKGKPGKGEIQEHSVSRDPIYENNLFGTLFQKLEVGMPLADVDGTMINYRYDGPVNGEVIMLSNSLAADLSMWKYQIPLLTEAGYRVLRYDNRGHGQSAAPPGPYSIEMLSLDALKLMDFLGLEKVHFCGLSLGGMVGQMLGACYGARLNSLILCDTASYTPFPKMWDERIEIVRKNGMAVLVDATIDRWFTKSGQERLQEDVEEIRRTIVNTSVEGYCGGCSAIRNLDLRKTIRRISTPTLVVVGEQDQGTPVSAAEFIKEQIALSRLKVIPDAAHFVNIEQSIIFNSTILSFLRNQIIGWNGIISKEKTVIG
ncbi:MAG: 3-oxoadipate enol-lactonase 2 [Smithella sp. PtaU1.Bin162]|nr:MAG: 3-oxoadipate enol-lactonase 2 [Smithella sp. PtaU1.Bin162]